MIQGKKKSRAFGKDVYLLGVDHEGTHYWLEEATWDCGWYWGGGYVETFTNDERPGQSRDINYHSHFDSMFFNGNKNGHDALKEFFAYTPFTDKELWQICELLKAFYIARRYSDMLFTGGAHYTSNPAKETIQCVKEYDRINQQVIPALMKSLYEVMSP